MVTATLWLSTPLEVPLKSFAQNKIPQLRSDAKSWRSGIEFFRVLQKNHQKGSDHQKDPQLAQAADSFGATSKQIGT